MSSRYINNQYGDQPESRCRSSGRSASLALDSKSRATSQTKEAQEITISHLRSPSVGPSKRWSSFLEHGSDY